MTIAACTPTTGTEVECRTAAIVGGDLRGDLLSIDPRQEAAICQVQLSGPDRVVAGVCTGVLVGSRTVLTAAHCFPPELPFIQVRFMSTEGKDIADSEGSVLAIDVEADLALVTLAAEPAREIVALDIGADAAAGLDAGQSVQIAGFGASPTGARQFAATQVTNLAERTFEVSASGYASACAGDSGGPALVRSSDGSVVVVGILSAGSKSCTGTDRYVRLDAARPWLAASVQDGTTASSPLVDCDLLGESGGCFGATALWCAGGLPRATPCGGDTVCGYSTEADGFRCVERGSDPCRGVDQFGHCQGTESHRCVAGKEQVQQCDLCGATCTISVRSGAAICNDG